MAASGKKDFPDMFEFSTANFSASAFDPDTFPDQATAHGKEDGKKKSALGGSNDSENSTSEELGLEWTAFGACNHENDAMFPGLENDKLLTNLQNENDKDEIKETSTAPRIKHSDADTATRGAHAKGTHHHHHHHHHHRGRKSGGDPIPKSSTRDRKSMSPRRTTSRAASTVGKSRSVSPKRSTLRRAASGGDIEDDEGGAHAKRKLHRRTNSSAELLDEKEDAPPANRTAVKRTTSNSEKTDLSRLKSTHKKKGCGESVASAPPPGSRRLPGRSLSAKGSRAERTERSMSPRRIVSSRNVPTETHGSDTEINNLLEDDGGTNESEAKTVKKKPTHVKSLSNSDENKSDENKRTASSRTLIAKPHAAGRSKTAGERGKHGSRVHSPSEKKSSSPAVPASIPDDSVNKRASGGSSLPKPHIAGRSKTAGERGKHGSRALSPAEKMSSSPSLTAKPHPHGRRATSRSIERAHSHRGTSPTREKSKQRVSSPNAIRPKEKEKEKRASCPDFGDDDGDSDDDEAKEDSKTDTQQKKNEEEKTEKVEQETEDIGLNRLLEGSTGDLTVNIDETTYVSSAAEGSDKEKKKKVSEPAAESVKKHETKDTEKKKPDDIDKSKKKSRERSPSRGVGRSRSMPKAPSTREISRSPSRLGRSERDHAPKQKREKSLTRDVKRAPTSMREVMSMELTKSDHVSKAITIDATPKPKAIARSTSSGELEISAPKAFSRSPSVRDVSGSPPRELRRGAGSTRDVSWSPSRGLTRSDGSARDVTRPGGLTKANSTMRIGSDNNKDQQKDLTKRAASPVRRPPQRATSDRVPRANRIGIRRATSSRSPVRDAARHRNKEDGDQLHDNSSGRLTDNSNHVGGRLRDGSDRNLHPKDDGSEPIPRNTSRGRLESKRVPRRLRNHNAEKEKEDPSTTSEAAPATEQTKNAQKPSRGPAMRRTLSGPGPAMRRTLSGPGPRGVRGGRNIQQRQLLRGLDANDQHNKELKSGEDELADSSSNHQEPQTSKVTTKVTPKSFPDEEIGDLFANSSWHSSTANDKAAETDDVPMTPRSTKLSAVTSAFTGTAKSFFGLNGSQHSNADSPKNQEGQSQGKDNKGNHTFRTSIFGGKGGKAIQGPSMLSLGSGGGLGDDLDSSSEEFA